MGRSSKKKKRGSGSGSGRKSKGRALSRDHASQATESNDLFAEELTALCAIFQEDCKLISDSPPHVSIKLRPYLKDMGYEDADVSAFLLVRCLPGYPFKCPKLQITPEKGLSRVDADNLLSLLQDQANLNAREGRVMIFNLVEAAQEFLSEIVPDNKSCESVPCISVDSGDQSFQKDMEILHDTTSPFSGPFVYGFTDIFCGLGESWWGFTMDDKRGVGASVLSDTLNDPAVGRAALKKLEKSTMPSLLHDVKHSPLASSAAKLEALETLQEESEVDSESITSSDTSRLQMDKLAAGDNAENEGISFEEHKDEENVGDPDRDSMESLSSPLASEQASQSFERDLIVVHLLRLACASKGPLADALPDVAVELFNIGIFSERVLELATKPSALFNKSFDHVFQRHMDSSRVSSFWKPASDFGGPISSVPSSRYLSDFEELRPLGHGAFWCTERVKRWQTSEFSWNLSMREKVMVDLAMLCCAKIN